MLKICLSPGIRPDPTGEAYSAPIPTLAFGPLGLKLRRYGPQAGFLYSAQCKWRNANYPHPNPDHNPNPNPNPKSYPNLKLFNE